MNNNPSQSPETSLLEQKNQGRTRVKYAVFSIIAVHVAGLTALLLTQGCKREKTEQPQPETPVMDTNNVPMLDTNAPSVVDTNAVMNTLTNVPSPIPTTTEVAPAATTEYVVAKGDSFSSIAKKFGVSAKAIATANPGVDSSHLKIGQKLNIPAAGAAVAANGNTTASTVTAAGETIYTVKSGDTLTRIASHHGITVKAIKSLNNLSTDRISVGQKLKLPAKPLVPEMPAPTTTTPPATAPGVPPSH
jgi:LysM repeat protein